MEMAIPSTVSLKFILWPSTNVSSNSGLLGFVVYGVAIITVPADKPVDPECQIDWVGASLRVSALILFNFVWK